MKDNMTDTEVIKALKCCVGAEIYGCRACPYAKTTAGCIKRMMSDAIALIEVLKDDVAHWKAENELLEKQRDNFTKQIYKSGIKEFAEKLKGQSLYVAVPVSRDTAKIIEIVPVAQIDRIANEMVGDGI